MSADLVLPLAHRALHPQHQLLRRLRLLPQDRLGLATKSLLLPIIPVIIYLVSCLKSNKDILGRWYTPPELNKYILNFFLPAPSLGLFRLGRLLVLGHLEWLVCPALWVGAVGFTKLWDIHHRETFSATQNQN